MTEQPRARGEGGPVDLSVVVPAYNEEDRLEASLEQILGALAARPAAWEVLVVDDGSADATSAIAERYADRGVRLLRQRQNRGKGAALRVGVLASRGARVLLTDADLSTPMTDLDRLWPRLDRADVVLGSRAVRGARITRRQPLYREVMGKVFNRLVRLAGAGSIRDTQCGFKLLDGEAARRLFALTITDGFAYDVEIVWLARRLGFGVVEVGVTWHNSPSSRVRPLVDPPKMLWQIARFRWRHRALSP